jgi:peptide deformylase
MPVHRLRLYGDPVLRRRAEPAPVVGADVAALVRDLFETMDAHEGVGLAAPQIGNPARVIVVDLSSIGRPEWRRAFVNPVLSVMHGRVRAREGCLSIPGVEAEVSRAESLRLKALDHEGKPVDLLAEGWAARVLQHEVDHLDGILFVDRLSGWRRALLRGKLDRIERRARRWL